MYIFIYKRPWSGWTLKKKKLQTGLVGLDLKKIKYGPGLDDDGFISLSFWPKKKRPVLIFNIHLLRRSIFEPMHFAITSLIHILMIIRLFPRIFGHRVTYRTKEQRMLARHFTQRLGNIFIHPVQIFFCFFYEVLKII
jgi:hypothetical protein